MSAERFHGHVRNESTVMCIGKGREGKRKGMEAPLVALLCGSCGCSKSKSLRYVTREQAIGLEA